VVHKLEALLVGSVVSLVSACGGGVFEDDPGSSSSTRESMPETGGGGGHALLPVPDCDIHHEDGATHIACGHQGPSAHPDEGAHIDTYPFSVTADAGGALIAIERDATHVIRLSPEGAAGALGVPTPVGYKTELATSASGVAYAVQRAGEAVVEVSLGTMEETIIPGAKAFFYRSDTLLVAANGAHHVFSGGAQHFVRDGSTWASEPMDIPSSLYDIQVTLDTSGQAVVLGQTDGQQVVMVQGGSAVPLGPPGVSRFAPVLPTIADLPASAPPTAVVLQHEDGFRVVWPSPDGQGEVFVPAPLFQTTCPTPEYPDCHAVCHDTGSGVMPGSFAAARATDGAVWLAYVVSQLDVDRGFAGEDDFVEVCLSQRLPETDQSTAALHVVRVSLDAAEAGVVSVGPAVAEPGADYYAAVDDVVRMRAHRDRLAIAVREHLEGRMIGLRIMQIDMTH
jgi:hypothetical protein